MTKTEIAQVIKDLNTVLTYQSVRYPLTDCSVKLIQKKIKKYLKML